MIKWYWNCGRMIMARVCDLLIKFKILIKYVYILHFF
jgi:hypothetical protein